MICVQIGAITVMRQIVSTVQLAECSKMSESTGKIVKFQMHYFTTNIAGCQLKTFKTFILMVKSLKPLFFSEKPLKTFI